jgi:hypothetical protein
MKKLSLILLLPLLLGGCLGLHFGGGTRSSVRNQSQTYDVTLGQQLLDLQKAYDSGVITEHEYKAQKKKLLKYYVRG